MRYAALALAALTLAGCETTQEKSAKLEREAKSHERIAGPAAAGLSITRAGRGATVTQTAVVRSSEGAAVAVRVRNLTGRALRDVPIEIHVRDASGRSIYANTLAGLGAPLRSVALLPAHGELTWVDDQIQPAGTPASVVALLGEGTPVGGAVPTIAVTSTKAAEASGGGPGAEGRVVNGSAVAQRELVVFAVARRGASVVAAGRAVVPELPAHGSAPFQVFLLGEPHGAQLEFSAPPTTFG